MALNLTPLADDQVAEGRDRVKAALAPKMAGTVGDIHGPDCDCTDEQIDATIQYVAAVTDQKVGAIDWATLLPLILQILTAIFQKKNPAPE